MDIKPALLLALDSQMVLDSARHVRKQRGRSCADDGEQRGTGHASRKRTGTVLNNGASH